LARFNGEEWFRQQVNLRTKEGLAQKQEAFAREHKDSTDEELLTLVRLCADALGKTPNAGEIIGGPYIAARFGSWGRVVKLANLPMPEKIAPMRERYIYKEEYRHQASLFRQERVAAKEARTQQHRERARQAAEAQKEQRARDMLWGEAHTQDTDEQLLDYVRTCAAQLGHTPVIKDVTGAYYISERFGSWSLVLTCARLPLPPGMDPPKPKTLRAYREKHARRSENNPHGGLHTKTNQQEETP